MGGQTEVLNRCLEQYLWAFVETNHLLGLIFWGGLNITITLLITQPLEQVHFKLYGRPPTSIPAYTRGSTFISVVEDMLLPRDEVLRKLRQHLSCSQQRMKQFADKDR